MSKWLSSEVAEGLQRLVACRLPGTPAADTMDDTVGAWTGALAIKGLSPIDSSRIKIAFVKLSAECDRWPSPKKLLDQLPPRPEPIALPKRKPDYSGGLENIKKLRSMIAGANLAMPVSVEPTQTVDRVPGEDDEPDFGNDACACRAQGTCPVCLSWAELYKGGRR